MALDRLSSRGIFPGRDASYGIAFERHLLGLKAAGVAPHASLGVRNSGGAQEPTRDRVAPELCGAGLIFELRENLAVPFRIHTALE